MRQKGTSRRNKSARAAFSAFLEPGEMPRWQLQDAKAQFSRLVGLAAGGAPQCVSVRGADAVVVLSYDDFMDALRPDDNLLEFFQSSPLVGSDIQLDRLPGNVREVEL